MLQPVGLRRHTWMHLGVPRVPGADHGTAGRRVLLADFQPVSRWLLQEVLRAEGHSVVVAAPGPDTVALAIHLAPDLLITHMPEENGASAALSTLRDHPATVATALLDLTARLPGAAAGDEGRAREEVGRVLWEVRAVLGG